MTSAPRRPAWAAGLLVLLALAVLAGWWLDARPVAVPDGTGGRLPCISYAPAREGADGRGDVTVEQLRLDFAVLARHTGCIRTYTVSEGFDRVPEIAREFGLEVLLGLWIGRDRAHNAKEIAAGVALARANRDVVRALVVGNEVMLRRELPEAELAGLIRQVATASGMPVTYADVWAYWRKHRALAREVAFVTVHVLPYWDDEPLGIDHVLPFVDALMADLAREFAGKPLFVGETGWPSAGRPRGPNEATLVNQVRFLVGFDALARERGWEYSVIEAFDQPWKIAYEGTVGGHWGLHDSHRREKFAWAGPVVEAPHGRTIAVAALGVGLAGALFAAALATRGRRAFGATLGGGAAALAVGVGARQWDYVVDGNVGIAAWLLTLAPAAIAWLAFAYALRSLGGARGEDGASAAGDAGGVTVPPRWLVLALLLTAAYCGLGLVFDARYRDFPVWLFLPGVLALASVALARPAAWTALLVSRPDTAAVLLAAWLVVAAVLVPLLEGFANARSIAWGASSAVLGLAVLVPLVLQARERQRAGQEADG
ncbi:MAG: hypothetical protein ACK52I_28140 [Pseudomonadota bacterium]